MTEEKLQEIVAAYLDLAGVAWFHYPAGGKRHKAVAAKMKRAGQKPGVPDVLIFEHYEDYEGDVADSGFGLAIELKVKGSYPRPNQRAWLDALERRGWRVAVCRSLEEVQAECRCLRPLSGRKMP